ncbi:CheA Signal Transduction Histidine Kinases (STHK) [Rivularia sp. IAM M-261]|nr:CheA Signal Transduction Histidine Kinases (STHK) [Rivularia sp. IAM M-261]
MDDKEREIQLQFIEEANNHLNTIEVVLSEPQISIHNINNAMRAAHSIKGGAGMMSFGVLSQYAHQLEDAFKVLKTKKQNLDIDEIQPLLLASVDGLRKILHNYTSNFSNNNNASIEKISDCFDKLHEILGEANPENASTILATEENSQEIIPLIFQTQVEDYLQQLESLIHQEPETLREELVTMAGELGGLGYMLQIESFTQLCESVINSISNAQTDQEVIEISKSALQTWRESQTLILKNQLNSIPTTHTPPTTPTPSTPTTPPPTPTTPPSTSPIRIGAKQLEVTNDLSSELTIQCQSLKLKLENLNEQFSNLKHCSNNIDLEYREISSNSINKVHLKPLQSQIFKLQEIINDIDFKLIDFNQTNSILNRTAQNLQNSLTQILMRPLTDILERLKRALHDLSLEYNKPVKLEIIGAETLIERSILDTIQEPLLHILRNAFDHGIEDRQTRINRGKAEQGLIEISITTTQNNIVIVVRDDGNGISTEKVRKRAEEIGFDRTLLAQATDDELLLLIFEAGFSTSDEVTALSGRGVGMDVVRSNIKQIDGDVKVSTQSGKGTQFTLTIPFNVLIYQVLFIESNSMLLACPTSTIREILSFTPSDTLLVAGQEYLYYQNSNIPLINLADYLYFNCNRPSRRQDHITAKTITKSAPCVLIVDYQQQNIAIKLDHCWGEQEAIIRSFESNIALPTGFTNCTITNNGQVVPIINWEKLLFSPPTQNQTRKNEDKTILIIDDSTNIRQLLARTLQKAGYQVEEASDGLQGLEKLQTALSIKAVICDIDMPNLDGFGFLAKAKAQPNFKHIPVILLTSHTGNRYRNLAFQLGAKAYLCKPYNEYELLKVLNE